MPDANAEARARLRFFQGPAESAGTGLCPYFTLKPKLPSVSWPSSVFMCQLTL